MSDWEAVVEFELENDFLLSRTTITWLDSMSASLRKNKCNKLADVCDIASHEIKKNARKRAIRRINARPRHAAK